MISIGIAVLRTRLFYAVAVTPYDIMSQRILQQQQQQLQQQQEQQQQQQHLSGNCHILPLSRSAISPTKVSMTLTNNANSICDEDSTPFREMQGSTSGQGAGAGPGAGAGLPHLPIESLSDVVVLRSLVRRYHPSKLGQNYRKNFIF